MLEQNKGDEEGIKRGLDAVIDHMYGDHSSCDLTWCGAVRHL